MNKDEARVIADKAARQCIEVPDPQRIELKRRAALPGYVHLIGAEGRVALRAFMVFLEYRHFTPGTPLNDAFLLAIMQWQEHAYYVLSFPTPALSVAKPLALSLGLRFADGVPCCISSENAAAILAGKAMPDFFPIFDGDNCFTIENIDGHFAYKNDPTTNRTAAQAEQEAIEQEIRGETPCNQSEPMNGELINGEEMALRHPDTFHIPSEEQKLAVKPGQNVKIGIRTPSGRAERFWVEVTEIDYPAFTGRVRNDLTETAVHGVGYDDVIEFEQQHILDDTEPKHRLDNKVFGPGMVEGEGYDLVPVPVGEKCMHCEEPIGPEDEGFLIRHLCEHGSNHAPYHRECFIRGVVGSVAHQLRQCSCFVPGATCGDNPKLTKRQAAKSAWQMFMWRQELGEVMAGVPLRDLIERDDEE